MLLVAILESCDEVSVSLRLPELAVFRPTHLFCAQCCPSRICLSISPPLSRWTTVRHPSQPLLHPSRSTPPITPDEEDSQQLLSPPPVISPEWATSAIRVSVAAFQRFALAHHTYMQKTTQERLNQQGNPTSFHLNDRVKIYVPPHQRPTSMHRSTSKTHRRMARTLPDHPDPLPRHL